MKKKSLKINALLNVIYTVINIAFPLITFPYVSRILQVELLGRVNFFSNVASYATMIAALGVSTYGIRTVARVKSNKEDLSKVTSELLFINFSLSILIVGALLASSSFICKFKSNFMLLCINCILILSTPLGINWFFSGLEEYEYITKRTLCIKFVSLLSIFTLIHNQNDYLLYAGIIVASSVAGFACNFVYSKRFVSLKFTELNIKQHLKPMAILFASILAINVYTHLDTIMLGFINGDEEVGLYTTAVYVKTALLTLVNAISAVLLPRISHYVKEGKQNEIRDILEKSSSLICMISVPLTAYFMIEANNVILVLGGREYIDAVPCMITIMPVLVISGFSNILGNQILIPLEKDNCFMKAVSIGAIVDLILNILLMPKLASVGAATATLIAEFVQMLIQFYFAKDYICKSINRESIFKIILSAFIASATLGLCCKFIATTPIISILISSVLFFGVYILVLFIAKEKYFRLYCIDIIRIVSSV